MTKIAMRIAKRLLLLEINKLQKGVFENYNELSNEGTQDIYNRLLEIKYEVDFTED